MIIGGYISQGANFGALIKKRVKKKTLEEKGDSIIDHLIMIMKCKILPFYINNY